MDQRILLYVKWRDGDCVARFANHPLWATRWPMLQGLPDPGPCRDRFGALLDAVRPVPAMHLEGDHVPDADGHAMGAKAPDDAAHLWGVCAGHHTGTSAGRQWATHAEVRRAAALYIAAANEAAAARWMRPPEAVAS